MNLTPTYEASPIVQNFLKWRDNALTDGYRGLLAPEPSKFIPEEALKEHFGEARTFSAILKAIDYEGDTNRDEIMKNYTKVLAILLHIGKAHFLDFFLRSENCSDNHLPLESEPSDFPKASQVSFFREFCAAQHLFCAPVFRTGRPIEFKPDRILAITEKILLKDSHSSTVYSTLLAPSHHEFQELSQNFQTKRKPNVYAIKCYKETKRSSLCEREKKMLSALSSRRQSDQGIIKYFGYFEHGETLNIILEFADQGTLGDYFHSQIPPYSKQDVSDLWASILALLKGLAHLHNLDLPGDDHDAENYVGIHQDIKLENILVVSGPSKYIAMFKLADFGLSTLVAGNSSGKVRAKDLRGSKTYGPPELCRWSETDESAARPVTPAADVWSLGCVLSEVAVWMTQGGEAGVVGYAEERQLETSRYKDLHDYGDCFHDGEKVLSSVEKMHCRIKEWCQDRDQHEFITPEVLEHLVMPMLEQDRKNRPHANSLARKAERLTNQDRENVHLNKRSKSQTKRANTLPQHLESKGVAFHNSTAPTRSETPTFGLERSQTTPLGPPPLAPLQRPPLPSIFNQVALRALSDSPESYAPNDLQSIRTNARSPETSPKLARSQRMLPRTHDPSTPTDKTSNTAEYPLSPPYSADSMKEHFRSSRNLTLSEPPKKRDYSYDLFDAAWEAISDKDGSLRSHLLGKKKAFGQFSDELNRMGKRDQVFVLDNSDTMREYSSKVKFLIYALEKSVRFSDDDGAELICSNPKNHLDKFNISFKPRFRGKEIDSIHKIEFEGKESVHEVLRPILDGFINAWEKWDDKNRDKGRNGKSKEKSWRSSLKIPQANPSPRPRMTCYIITDGVGNQAQEIDQVVRDFVPRLQAHNAERIEFGIQVIFCGNDGKAKDIFDRLDKGYGLPIDVVDTESIDGNFLKITLGPIDERFDDAEAAVSDNRDSMSGSLFH